MVENRKLKARSSDNSTKVYSTCKKSGSPEMIKANKSLKEKKSMSALKGKNRGKNGNTVEPSNEDQLSTMIGHTQDETICEYVDPMRVKSSKKKSDSALRSKKSSRKEKGNGVNSDNGVQLPNEDECTVDGLNDSDILEANYGKESTDTQTSRQIGSSNKRKESNNGAIVKTKKIRKDRNGKKKDFQNTAEHKVDETLSAFAEKVDEISSVDEDCSRGMKNSDILEANYAKESTDTQTSRQIGSSNKRKESNNGAIVKTKKMKKDRHQKKKDLQNTAEHKVDDTLSAFAEKVDEISSVDEDCSRGMKKWLIKYQETRPGLDILQQRIDDFITTYEEQREQEREAREALAAEGGWTVVVHHKGRKKTTDIESSITVGSVAPAAVVDKMGKKKNKEAAVDFYRFQKREAQRNEVMMLQSKFEQDKKRIQQLRAARKFRPY